MNSSADHHRRRSTVTTPEKAHQSRPLGPVTRPPRAKSIRHGHLRLFICIGRESHLPRRAVLFAQLVDDPSARRRFPTDAEEPAYTPSWRRLVVENITNDELFRRPARDPQNVAAASSPRFSTFAEAGRSAGGATPGGSPATSTRWPCSSTRRSSRSPKVRGDALCIRRKQ